MNNDIENIMKVLGFLFWLEKDQMRTMYGGYKISDVLDSIQVLFGYDDETWGKIKGIIINEKIS